MKISALLLLIAFLLANCVSTKPTFSKCSEFKEGRYGFTKTKIDDWGTSKEMTLRIDSLETIILSQHLTNPTFAAVLGSDIRDTITYKISWLGDCSYERTLIKSSVRLMNSLITSVPKISDKYEIISFTDKYYIEQSFTDKSRRDTFWIQQSNR